MTTAIDDILGVAFGNCTSEHLLPQLEQNIQAYLAGVENTVDLATLNRLGPITISYIKQHSGYYEVVLEPSGKPICSNDFAIACTLVGVNHKVNVHRRVYTPPFEGLCVKGTIIQEHTPTQLTITLPQDSILTCERQCSNYMLQNIHTKCGNGITPMLLKNILQDELTQWISGSDTTQNIFFRSVGRGYYGKTMIVKRLMKLLYPSVKTDRPENLKGQVPVTFGITDIDKLYLLYNDLLGVSSSLLLVPYSEPYGIPTRTIEELVGKVKVYGGTTDGKVGARYYKDKPKG